MKTACMALAAAIAGLLALAACQPAAKAPDAETAAACPDKMLPASHGRAWLDEGFSPDPWHGHVAGGGGADLARCRREGQAGYVAAAPVLDIHYRTSGWSDLKLFVQSSAATVLLVSTPDGRWLYDDGARDGRPAVIVAHAGEGFYSVWVGARRAGERPEAILFVTEVASDE